jgi:hypothetical protein
MAAAARLFRPRVAAAEEVERSIARTRAGCPMGVTVAVMTASGQAPSSPAADRQKEVCWSKAQWYPTEAWACRQSPAAAEARRLARSSAAEWARRWAAPVALAAAAVALRSGQMAALHAPEAAAEEVAAVESDAAAALRSEEEEPLVGLAGAAVEEEAQQDAAAVLRSEAAPDVRERRQAALPSAAAWAFHRDRVRRRPAP